jgi:hypothetical protein
MCALLNKQIHANHSSRASLIVGCTVIMYHQLLRCGTAAVPAACAHCSTSRAMPTIQLHILILYYIMYTICCVL